MQRILTTLFAVFMSTALWAGEHKGDMAEKAKVPGETIKVHKTDQGIPYVTGGVGDAAQAAIEARYGDYSFKLVNVRAEPDAEAYVSNVDVTLKNAEGDTILETTVDGPWLLSDLPAGSYKVAAEFQGHNQTQSFNVSETGHERLVLLWPTSDKDR